MLTRYVLDQAGAPVEESNLLKWAQWYESADRHVGLTMIREITVSTVFLGLDHNFSDRGPPILFETMIFGGEHDSYQVRSATIEEAELDHAEAVAIVRNLLPAEVRAD